MRPDGDPGGRDEPPGIADRYRRYFAAAFRGGHRHRPYLVQPMILPRHAGCRGGPLARLPAAEDERVRGPGLRLPMEHWAPEGRRGADHRPGQGHGRGGQPRPLPGRAASWHWRGAILRAIRDRWSRPRSAMDGGEALGHRLRTLRMQAHVKPSVAVTTRGSLGPVDILVNVAGGSGPIGKTGVETDAGGIRRHRRAQHRGPFNMMRAVLPGMMAGDRQDRQCRRHFRHARQGRRMA